MLLALPVAVEAQFTYTTNNGTITIAGYNGPGGAVAIPNTVYGLPVVSVGTAAFYYNHAVTSIVIPNGVTNIGTYAFNWCNILTNVSFPNSLISIEDYAFQDSGLTTLAFPSSLRSIGAQTFSGCTALRSLTISNGLTSIPAMTFHYCSSLTSVTFPGSLTSIGSDAFIYCSSLTYVSIPASVTSIGSFAFANCTSLTNVSLTANLASIGSSAFQNTRLTSVTIPSTVTSIGSQAFSNCDGITNITVDPLNPSYSSSNGILFNKSQTLLMLYPPAKSGSAYNIPASARNVDGYAFYHTMLANVTFLNAVTNIGAYAFNGCTNLVNVTIPKSLVSFGESAFAGCTKLVGLYFGGNAPMLLGKVSSSDPTIIYYLPGATGWNTNYGGRPTVLWNPTPQKNSPNFGVRTNRFGFDITGTANIPLVVEACTNFGNPIWLSLQSCTLTNGTIYFSDPQWMNYPSRFYRLRSP
ncbi:MAG: leucine-rich repeat domain-containing protein [Verrucomicrobia bacterium]|nr:MAG: leucine-rich repeat domain-containing protein [Verrucomicrobiota bacterium]